MSKSDHVICVQTTKWVIDALHRLSSTGRFPRTPHLVAEELLRQKLREVEREGWLKQKFQRGDDDE